MGGEREGKSEGFGKDMSLITFFTGKRLKSNAELNPGLYLESEIHKCENAAKKNC